MLAEPSKKKQKKPADQILTCMKLMIKRSADEALEKKTKKSADQVLTCMRLMIKRYADGASFEKSANQMLIYMNR